MKVEHKWDERGGRVYEGEKEKGDTRHVATCFVEKGMKLVSSWISKDGKRFTGCKCARLSKLRRDFSKFPVSEPSPDYIKFFSITGNSPTVPSLSLSARLSVSELGKKRLPSRFVRAKVLFSLVFFCHTKILSDNRKVFFSLSRFSFSHSLCVFFISFSFSFPPPPFFLRFIISSMKDDTGTFARAHGRAVWNNKYNGWISLQLRLLKRNICFENNETRCNIKSLIEYRNDCKLKTVLVGRTERILGSRIKFVIRSRCRETF